MKNGGEIEGSLEKIEDRLKYLLHQPGPLVVALSGEWGVGKTFFWHKFKKDHLANKTTIYAFLLGKICFWNKSKKNHPQSKTTIYVSLFGKDSIQDIRADIAFQVKTRAGWAKSIYGLSKIIKIPSTNLSLILGWILEKTAKDVVICFDDFERLSEKLSMKDVLGLISELKEQQECRVMMILNQDQLKTGKEDFSTYKDKIIDYEFHYAPTPSESFRLVKEELKAFTNYPLEDYFQRKNINNIRVMRRVINALNDFVFNEEQIMKYGKSEPQFVGKINHGNFQPDITESIIAITAINAQSLSVDFSKLIEYYDHKTVGRIHGADAPKKEEEMERLLSLTDENFIGNFLTTDIAQSVISYNKTSLVDQNKINEIIAKRKIDQESDEIQRNFELIIKKKRFDMDYSRSQYVSDLWDFLQTNSAKVYSSPPRFRPEDFIGLIKNLEEQDGSNKSQYHDFAVEILKVFLSNHPHYNCGAIGGENNIVAFDDELRIYHDQLHLGENRCQPNTKEKMMELMLNIAGRTWSTEPDLLDHVSEEEIEQYIFEDQEFFETVLGWLSSSLRLAGQDRDSMKYKQNLLNISRKIESTSTNEDHKIKIRQLLRVLAPPPEKSKL